MNVMSTTNLLGKVKVDGYRCERCGHIWTPRKSTYGDNIIPVLCPACRSAYWNRQRERKQ